MPSIVSFALPLLRLLPPERAHRLTIRALAANWAPRAATADDAILATRVWDMSFPNPVGLAAGFDKNAEVPDAMLRWGFGFVEVGSVTPRPQAGNPKPRLFRLPRDEAVINRMGFNNDGLDAVEARLEARRREGILGANLGKNRDSASAAADYSAGVARLAALSDYLVINVSSPNTPGLRDLQRRSDASMLVAAVIETRNGLKLDRPPPLLLKIAPDLTPQDCEDIAAVALESGIDGLIVSNTTVARPAELASADAHEPGGLSGRPLFEPSTRLLAEMYRLTGGKLPLIGVGGIGSGSDAYLKIRAGASLVQLYTALAYHGPALIDRIKRELAALLRRDGFASVAAAVGTGADRVPSRLDRQGA
ncbi:MAG TPA: quinone-dependent dihydroorotate dehydrogenase [Aliidongia sp.]|nr:quinone-dependent dihydroorotate dehydrogenase [Aliidongia sp.]